MPYPQIEDALTATVGIRKGKVQILLQEWPFQPGMRFFRMLKNVMKAVREDYGKDADSLTHFKIMTEVKDADGNPVMEEDKDTGEPKVKTQLNVALVLKIAETVSSTMDDNAELMIDCVDAAIVQRPNAPTPEDLRKLPFGDVIALFRQAITLNFMEGSSLGDALKELFQMGSSSESPTTPQTGESSPAPATPPTAPVTPTTPPQS